jgi:hypothetical protein
VRTGPGHHTGTRPPKRSTTSSEAAFTVAHRFGQPSNYSLAPQELAAHIRRLRRQGWQSWEVVVRFDTEQAA